MKSNWMFVSGNSEECGRNQFQFILK